MKNIIEKIKNFIKNFKINSKQYLKTNILFTTFVLTSLVNGILLRFLTVKNYFGIRPIIADLAIILLIGSFGYLIKPKHQFKYFFGWSIFFTLVCIINSMYYTNYVSFASFSLLATSLQIVDVGDAVTKNVMEYKDFCYLWQIFVMIVIHIILKTKQYYKIVGEKENGKLSNKKTLKVGLIITILFIITLTPVEIGRLTKQWNRDYVVMRFGIYTYQFNDLITSLKPQISPLFGYDKNYKLFRDYYKNQDDTKEINEYTDIFKGKNLLMIHAESMQNFVIGETFNGVEVTPTLNKLASEGLYFSNFYSQESVGTSSDTEFTLNNSLMPSSSGTVFVNYWDREYVTIPKLLKEQGYYTFSMHGNKCTFWNRNLAHESFGYNNFYCGTKDFIIDETIGLGLSDKSFFKQAIPKLQQIVKENNNFYGTMIMLTNHTPFVEIDEVSDFEVDYKYETVNSKTGKTEIVSAPYLEGTILGSYFKSVNYADEALGQFINDLDNSGLLENTVVVIYGDHDSKLKKKEYERYYNYDPYTDSVLDEDDPNYQEVTDYSYEINRKIPLIIWSKDVELSREVTEVMGMYDVLPTLGNMFGFESKYALGNDIFSVDENVVVFPTGNWITNKMYYNSAKEEGYLIDPTYPVSMDYINKYNKIADEKIAVSNAIIVYDLIKEENE